MNRTDRERVKRLERVAKGGEKVGIIYGYDDEEIVTSDGMKHDSVDDAHEHLEGTGCSHIIHLDFAERNI